MFPTPSSRPSGATTPAQLPELVRLVRLLAREAAREAAGGATPPDQQDPSHDHD